MWAPWQERSRDGKWIHGCRGLEGSGGKLGRPGRLWLRTSDEGAGKGACCHAWDAESAPRSTWKKERWAPGLLTSTGGLQQAHVSTHKKWTFRDLKYTINNKIDGRYSPVSMFANKEILCSESHPPKNKLKRIFGPLWQSPGLAHAQGSTPLTPARGEWRQEAQEL